MHVLLIPSWYKTKESPFAGTFFEEQARMLQRSGHTVGVLFPQHLPSFFSFIKSPRFSCEEYDDAGIRTIVSTTKSVLPSRWGYLVNKRIINKYVITAFNQYVLHCGLPDVIHAHSSFWGGVVAQNISSKTGISYVVTEHLSTLVVDNEFDVFPYNRFVKNSLQNASKVAVVSTYFQEQLVAKYKLTNTCVVPNVVNPVFFKLSSSTTIADKCKLLIIGNFVEKKRIEIFVQSLEYFKKKGLLISATLIGKGALQNEYESLIAKLHLEDVIEIKPQMGREDIAKEIVNCHILVSTSQFETFGLTIAEAHAVGRPTVLYDCKGARDFTTNDNSVVVHEMNPQCFADAIEKVWVNYSDYVSEKISRASAMIHSETVICAKLETMYKSVDNKSSE